LESEIIDYLKIKDLYSHKENINQLLLSLIDRIKQEILDILEDDSLKWHNFFQKKHQILA